MIVDHTYAAFRRDLLAGIERTRRDWGTDRDPDVLTCLCPRRFPVNRAGKLLLSLDQRLADVGRHRYLSRGDAQ